MNAGRPPQTSDFADAGDVLPRPHLNCYWLLPGRLLAGQHPFANAAALSDAPLQALLDTGVRRIIDLTCADEGQADYDAAWRNLAGRQGHAVQRLNFPVKDFSVPAHDVMNRILAALDHALGQPGVTYLHCQGGAGRTGTVVGCLLASHGMPPEQALSLIRSKWQVMEKRERVPHSPETVAQRAFVLGWPRSDHLNKELQ